MSSSSQPVESWISTFCSLMGHEYFAEVSEDFIEDDFNLTGLGSQVPMYKEALEMILDVEPDDEEEEEDEDEDGDDDESAIETRTRKSSRDPNQIESSAELLYGLIHQRYIISRPGIHAMQQKYETGHFGFCPRVFCNGCKVLPVGCSDTPGIETVKLFCPSCLDIYAPPNSRFQNVDGAFFGTTFGSLFFITYPELQFHPNQSHQSPTSTPPDPSPYQPSSAPNQPAEIAGVALQNFAPGLGDRNIYEPRIFGFRVSDLSRTGPRMQWLRQKPEDVRELDESARYHAEYGDSDEPTSDDMQTTQQPEAAPQAQVEGRKKAPMRRRRRISSEEAQGDDVGTNGVG